MHFFFRNGKAILYDKLLAKNDSTVVGLSKEEWKDKDILECIYDDFDNECNLKPGSLADLSIVSKITKRTNETFANSQIIF